MTDKKTEALKLAQEAIDDRASLTRWKKARDAIREALAEQPAQQEEPVEWGVDWGQAGETPCATIIQRTSNGGIKVLAVEYGPPASKPWVVLTKEEILEINDTVREQQGWLAFVRAIEAKLKEKNT